MSLSYDKIIGGNIAIARQRAGLTQEMLAARLQVSGCDLTRSALAKIESGCRHIYVHELFCMKEALSISYDDLFVGMKQDNE